MVVRDLVGGNLSLAPSCLLPSMVISILLTTTAQSITSTVSGIRSTGYIVSQSYTTLLTLLIR